MAKKTKNAVKSKKMPNRPPKKGMRNRPPIRTPNKYTPAVIERLGDDLVEWMKIPDHFWLGSFAEEKGINRRRFPEFAEKNEKFSRSYDLAKQHQENKLVLGGLTGKLSVPMAIFALKNVAGWRDKKELTGLDDGPLEINITLSDNKASTDGPHVQNNV